MRTIRWTTVVGLLGVLGGLAFAGLPISGNGVSGNALRPIYSKEYGVEGYAAGPLDGRSTLDDLRHAGITLPQDVVNERRRYAATAVALGLIMLTVGRRFRRRRVER